MCSITPFWCCYISAFPDRLRHITRAWNSVLQATHSRALLAGAGQFLQLSGASSAVVNTCADNIGRVAYTQRIADFTRALFFTWFWPPIPPEPSPFSVPD